MTQRTAVITGANSGFGRLTANAFAADGWRVYATMRNSATKNAQAATELRSAGSSVVDLDVTSDASVDAAAKTILAEAGSIDVLVNNAGTVHLGIEEAFTLASVEAQFATNVFGPLRVNRAFLPAMREQKRGVVVFVSSLAGRLVIPFSGVYTASKWALEALAEASSYELAPFGIGVAIVEPGAFPTEIFSKVFGADDAARVAAYGSDFAKLEAQLNEGLAQAAKDRNSQEVADAILRIANAPANERPLRTPVPADPAVEAVNAATAPIQRELIEALGFESLLSKVPA
jgi:NAD(P)-dependent dehydrogenase (short-subunit alcohol dehydrogenase family)